MNLLRYTLTRLIALFLQITGAIAVIITITTLVNLDPSLYFAAGSQGQNGGDIGVDAPSAAEIAQFRKDIGYNQPILVRFWNYITALYGHADFGNSWYNDKKPVSELYVEAFTKTMTVFGLGMILFTILAIVLGILAARRLDGTLDKNVRFSTSLFYSFPPFVLGTLLIFFMQGFIIQGLNEKLASFLNTEFNINASAQPFKDLFDGTMSQLSYNITFRLLPIIAVVLIYTGFQFRLVRIYMSEVLNQNYIRTAHAKGLDERTILIKHGMRNALPEIITSIATTFPVAFSGIAVLEKVFGINGSGLLLINAGLLFNWPVLIGGAVIFTSLNAIILTVTDLVVNYIDPQLRLR